MACFLHLYLYIHKRRKQLFAFASQPIENMEIIIVLSWAVAFLILAVMAGVLGFGGIAGTAAGVAQVLFFVFMVLLIASALASALRNRHG